MSPEKLVYMANQIGKFFKNQPEAMAVASIADHVRKFWDPRMRKAIFAHLDAGGPGLDPLPMKAVGVLKAEAEKQLA
jgi:formate dehydrogenase subunit delta